MVFCIFLLAWAVGTVGMIVLMEGGFHDLWAVHKAKKAKRSEPGQVKRDRLGLPVDNSFNLANPLGLGDRDIAWTVHVARYEMGLDKPKIPVKDVLLGLPTEPPKDEWEALKAGRRNPFDRPPLPRKNKSTFEKDWAEVKDMLDQIESGQDRLLRRKTAAKRHAEAMRTGKHPA